jgi:hypothetical protein
MGCDEYVAGAATGPLSVALTASYTNVATGFEVEFKSSIDGYAAYNEWDFGDGVRESNRLHISHAWTTTGTFPVVVRAYNQTWPDGIGATNWVRVQEGNFVDAAGTNPIPPYLSWETAATNIQDAVDAVFAGGLVLVTNGIYANGGRAVIGTMTNRVAIDKPITVQSVNGPNVTVIEGAPAPGGGNGDGAIRRLYLGANATLSGFTLTNGFTRSDGDHDTERTGGGAWCKDSATLSNCLLTGNSAEYAGGGAYGGTLHNSTVIGNSVGFLGGGVTSSVLFNSTVTGNSAEVGGGGYRATYNNCTVVGNSASQRGGGAYVGTLNNCIVYFNSAPQGANYYSAPFAPTSLNYSCTTPLPTNGVGNITNAPLFVNTNDWSDLRLRYGSPGIDAGTNLSALLTTDLDDNPRPLDGDGDGVAAFDMGAYEFDARSIIPPDWFTRHGLDANDPHVVSGNPDHDAFTTFQEWLAGTDPTNALCFFHIEAISKHSPAAISFQSSSNRAYTLWSTPQLSPPDWLPVPGAQAVPGTDGIMTLSDTNNALEQFYRMEVNLP